MADTDVQGMLVRIEATTAQLRQEMARADSSVGQASGKIDKSLSRIDGAFDRAGDRALNASGLIKTALAGAIGAAGIGKIIEAADSYGQMSDRIGMATSSVSEYDLVQQRLLDTAKRTYRPLAEAQELYIRTSGSLKSMGYNTSQALDVMDSFSFLLVTNSASADKAKSAIDGYSKALQTGKVDADGWQAMLAAMPTIVETVAKATGKTAEEIRALGAAGKLGLELLTQGLQKTADANGKLADSMTVAVRDALQNLTNSFDVYVGRLDDGIVQAGGIGINTKSQVWNLVHTGENVLGEELPELLAFLDRHEGYKAFRYAPPGEPEGWYRTNGYKKRALGEEIYTVTFTVKQVFNPRI